MFGSATDACEPSMRNSNLFPVKAKGEVRFLSVVSMGKMGDSGTPMEPGTAFFGTYSLPRTMLSTSAPSWSPRYTETMAGGASFAPRRWSFPAEATQARRSP